MKWFRLAWVALVLSVILLVPEGTVFAKGGRSTVVHYYLGNDPARWRAETGEPPGSGNAAASSPSRLDWSRYIGDFNIVAITKIRAGSDGSTYVLGTRSTLISVNNRFGFLPEVSVTRLDKSGVILYQTYLGGKGADEPLDLAVDGAGNAWVVGHTDSRNFPLRRPLQEFPAGGFVVKLDPTGRLAFSTYFAVHPRDSVRAVATGASGGVYVAGETFSARFPVTPGAFQPTGEVQPEGGPITSTGFVSKLSADGSALLYSTYVGGKKRACGGSGCLSIDQYDRPVALAVDAAGAAYVAGSSNKLDFPTTAGAFQPAVAGPFVCKLAPDGSRLEFSTGIGTGGELDKPSSIEVGREGQVYLAGKTSNPDFPVTAGAFQTVYSDTPRPSPIFPVPPSDAFLLKLDRTGSSLIYSTYLGAPGSDEAKGLAVAADGSAFVTGFSERFVFPADDPSLPAGSDFVARFDPSGSRITYSARFPNGAAGEGVALVGEDDVRLGGTEGYVMALNLTAEPGRTIMALSNSAASRVSGRSAPGMLVSIWGQGLGPKEPVGGVINDGFFTKDLGGTQVFFDEFAAPLLYVSGTQINAVVPFGIAGRWKTRVRVLRQGSALADLSVGVIPVAPEVFRDPDGKFAAALNEDGSVNSAQNPAKPGSFVAIFLTGAGELQPVPEDGSVNSPPARVSGGLSVSNLLVTYAGSAPGLVAGVAQVNFQLPLDASQEFPFSVTMGTYRSEQAWVHVTR